MVDPWEGHMSHGQNKRRPIYGARPILRCKRLVSGSVYMLRHEIMILELEPIRISMECHVKGIC